MKRSLLGIGFFVIVTASASLVSGCASLNDRALTRVPLTLEQIVELAKQGKEPAAIINEIRATHAVYDIAASQYAKLSKDGVPDSVLDFLQAGQLKMAERQGRREAFHDMWFNSRFGLGYGGIGYGAGWRGAWVPRPYTVYVNGKAQSKEY